MSNDNLISLFSCVPMCVGFILELLGKSSVILEPLGKSAGLAHLLLSICPYNSAVLPVIWLASTWHLRDRGSLIQPVTGKAEE